jgi:hypothetical protein
MELRRSTTTARVLNWLPEPSKYEVARVERVQSPCLGYTQWVFYAVVILYTGVYVLLVQKRYLSFESPDGTVRLTLQRPDEYVFPNVTGYPYCGDADPNMPGRKGASQLSCQFRDQYFARYPEVEKNAMFASTFVNESQQKLSGDCAKDTTLSSAACVKWEDDNADGQHVKSYYVTAIEDFTVLIDHSFVAPLADLSASSTDNSISAGWICGKEEKAQNEVTSALDAAPTGAACDQGSKQELDPCDDYRADDCPDFVHVGAGGKDIVPLRTLLRAAGINTLEDGDYKNSKGVVMSHRYAGLILQVKIVYNNHAGTVFKSLKTANYHYEVQHIKTARFSGQQVLEHSSPTDNSGGNTRTIRKRSGIRLVFTVTGSIGKYNLFEVPLALSACVPTPQLCLPAAPLSAEWHRATALTPRVLPDGPIPPHKINLDRGAAILSVLMVCLNGCILNSGLHACFRRCGSVGQWQDKMAHLYDTAKYGGPRELEGRRASAEGGSGYQDLTAPLNAV